MSIVSGLEKIEAKVNKAFDAYCKDLEQEEQSRADEFTGKLVESIEVYEKRSGGGTMEAKVGVNVPKLISIQLNSRKVNYAEYYIEGHKRVLVPFDSPVPGASEPGKDGKYWHVFRSSNGKPFISDALKATPKFKTYMK